MSSFSLGIRISTDLNHLIAVCGKVVSSGDLRKINGTRILSVVAFSLGKSPLLAHQKKYVTGRDTERHEGFIHLEE